MKKNESIALRPISFMIMGCKIMRVLFSLPLIIVKKFNWWYCYRITWQRDVHDARCGVHLNQVIDEVHKNGTHCEMIMMAPPTPIKNVDEGNNMWGGQGAVGLWQVVICKTITKESCKITIKKRWKFDKSDSKLSFIQS
jgi:hypothetical protein